MFLFAVFGTSTDTILGRIAVDRSTRLVVGLELSAIRFRLAVIARLRISRRLQLKGRANLLVWCLTIRKNELFILELTLVEDALLGDCRSSTQLEVLELLNIVAKGSDGGASKDIINHHQCSSGSKGSVLSVS